MIIVARADTGDIADIARLWAQGHEPHVAALPWYFRNASPEKLAGAAGEWFRDPAARVLVARKDGLVTGYVVGMVRIRPERDLAKEYRALYLDQIAVDAGVRRQGVGRALVENLIRIAREESLQRVDLDTWEFNEVAQRFFASFGFVPQIRKLSLDLNARGTV